MKIYLYVLLSLLTSCAQLSPNPNRGYNPEVPVKLSPFITDYCSEWPEGEKENPEQWAGCCFTHDLHYWLGGTDQERERSDVALKECVKLSGAALTGFLMYIGVRLGGKPGDAAYSWGYGWTQSRGYAPLDQKVKAQAIDLLSHSPYMKNKVEKKLILDFINTTLKP